MTETIPTSADKPAPAMASADIMVQEYLLTVARMDFLKRLDFLMAYVEQCTGHPERRSRDMPVDQLREEWDRKGVIVRKPVANIAASGFSIAETREGIS